MVVEGVGGFQSFYYILKNDGTLWSWGDSSERDPNPSLGRDQGQKGNQLGKVMDDVIYIAPGMAIKSDGSLWSWGIEMTVGNGSGEPSFTPVKIMDDVVAVCGGSATLMVQKSDGSLWAMGDVGGMPGSTVQDGEEEIITSFRKILDGVKLPTPPGGGATGSTTPACTGHTWEIRTEAATATSPGRTWRVCKVCGVEETLSTTEQKTHTGSGNTSMAKLSQEEIRQLLRDNPLDLPKDLYDNAPSTSAPYAAGKVKDSALQATVNRLNALRRIAGIPAVSLDAGLCQDARYGAVVMAANNQLSHFPSKPADMDQTFFKKGYDACSSNIYMGHLLTCAVDGFMDDSDGGNIDHLGHRRWQLNPFMGKIGFGCAGNYCAEKVFDLIGAGGEFEYVSWPAFGNFPSDLFNNNQAWSVSLNPDVYASPSGVSVTLSGGGKSWTFQGRDYTAVSSGKYFNVNTDTYGSLPCIIFRPDGVDSYSETYAVSISGLRYKAGGDASLEYTVDFFSLGEQQPPAQNNQTDPPGQNGGSRRNPFTDVPSNTYYTDAVLWALDNGITYGTTATTFEPHTTCTRGQVVTFLWRACRCRR